MMLNVRFIQGKKGCPIPCPLERLELKTLASDGVIKTNNVKIIPLPFYYVKLYMLYPLIGPLIFETYGII